MRDAQTIAAYSKAAKRYATGELSPRNLDYGDDIAAFSAGLAVNGRILDIGCDLGAFVILTAAR